MANAMYDSGRDRMMNSNNGGWTQLDWTLAAQDFQVALIDTGAYTVNLATHDFWDDASAGLIGSLTSIATRTTDGAGVADAVDTTISSVTGTTVEALIIIRWTGVAGTSELLLYIDTAGATLPFTPNGSDVKVQWNASGIFKI